MFIFITIGIGLFTILGLQTTLDVGLNPSISILMGVVSSVFGGVIRDVLSNIVPLIFRSEIYASACAAGGLVYLLLDALGIQNTLNMVFSMGVAFIICYFAIRKKLTLKV